MVNLRLKRGIGSITAAALVLSGASLALAAPANAEPGAVRVTSINPNEDTYLGWHEGTKNGASASSLSWAGLSLGTGADSQILNGLVDSGAPGIEISSDELLSNITHSQIKITSGAVYKQVPVTFGTSGWATLRPAAPETLATDIPFWDRYTALWVSSQPIGELAANTPVTLEEVGRHLRLQGNLRYSGFGLFAQASAPAVVSSMVWDGWQYFFSPSFTKVAERETINVAAADIRADESTYAGWHEGYENSTPAFSITGEGLSLGNGANSQIINGFKAPSATSDLASLIISGDMEKVSGTAHFQLPLTYGADNSFTTLRQNTVWGYIFSPYSAYISSKAIPATDSTPAIAANTSVPFGTMISALEAHGNIKVLGFGILAEATDPVVVESVLWNGVRYNFVPKATTPPVEPTTPPVEPTTPPVKPTTPPVEPTTPPVEPTTPPVVAPVVGTGMPSTTAPSAPGSSFTFTASGFTPNSDVQVFMHSTPVLLGTFRADALGVVKATVTIPAGAEAGTHHIVLVDSVTGFTVSSAAFAVSPAAAATNVKAATDAKSVAGALASTGFDALMPALLAGLLVLAGLGIGAFQLVTKRRRTAQ